MRRRAPVTFLSLLLIGILHASGAMADGVPDEQYVPPLPTNGVSVGIFFLDNLFANVSSVLFASATLQKLDSQFQSTVNQSACNSYDDEPCTAGTSFDYFAHLPRCLGPMDTDCIESIFAVNPDGVKVAGVFESEMPEKLSNPFLGEPKLGIPRPGLDGIWRLPGIINGGGTDQYLVNSVLQGYANKTPGEVLAQPAVLTHFSAGIFPVKVISGTYVPSYAFFAVGQNGTKSLSWMHASGNGAEACAAVSSTACALREAFPSDTAFGLRIRLSQALIGWLHGRLRDPLIDFSSTTGRTNLTIQALPVSVPVVATWIDRAKLPTVIPGYGPNPSVNVAMNGSAFADGSINILKFWIPWVNDTAQANPTEWLVRNMMSSEMRGADSCMLDSKTLAGVVTTNSTVYSAGPPKFNAETQSLDYTLVSPHYTSKGAVFKGVYTLAIKSEVARCIYHFTDAPIKATISITDNSGTSSVAVQSVAEHGGWIYLSASNFEFSSPTVHVKLMQNAPVSKRSATPQPTATMKPQAKRGTITCPRRKVSKRVTGLSPKCPADFKKK